MTDSPSVTRRRNAPVGSPPARFQPAPVPLSHLRALLTEKLSTEAVRIWTLLGYIRLEEKGGGLNLRHREAIMAELGGKR